MTTVIAGHEMTPERCAMWLEIVARGEAGLNVGGPSHFAVMEAKRLMEREELVQEVIAKHKACIEAYKAGRFAVAEEALFEAVQNLAGWKP